jgi:hypothetical protein
VGNTLRHTPVSAATGCDEADIDDGTSVDNVVAEVVLVVDDGTSNDDETADVDTEANVGGPLVAVVDPADREDVHAANTTHMPITNRRTTRSSRPTPQCPARPI